MSIERFNFSWDHAKNFLVVAQEGTISAAAKTLKISQPTLSRQISSLEEELGMDLFERSAKGLFLTAAGSVLAEHVTRMASSARDFSIAASNHSKGSGGKVVVSAPEMVASHILTDVVCDVKTAHSAIDVELQVTSAMANILEREADIAIRNIRPTQADLITRKLLDGLGRMYATKEYIESLGGSPLTPQALQDATFINFNPMHSVVVDMNPEYLRVAPRQSPLVCSSELVGWELVKKGLGIGIMIEQIGDNEPQLQRVLPEFPPLEFELWIVVHRELRSTPALQVVFDAIVTTFDRFTARK